MVPRYARGPGSDVLLASAALHVHARATPMLVPAVGFLLALGAALAWSGLDATRKALVRHVAPIPLVVLLSAGQAPVFAAWSGLETGWIGDTAYLLPGLTCLVLNVLANVGFVRAVQLSPLSLTVPMLSFTPVFATLSALVLVGEVPSRGQLAGIGLVVAGAFLLHAGPHDAPGLLGPWRAFVRERGSLIMVMVALFWSFTAALDKVALQYASTPAHALVQTGGVGLGLLGWLAARGRTAELARIRGKYAVLAAAVVFATSAIALQLLAIQATLVALVETIKRAVGMAMSVLVGWWMFHEKVSAFHVLGIALMALGTAALLWQ